MKIGWIILRLLLIIGVAFYLLSILDLEIIPLEEFERIEINGTNYINTSKDYFKGRQNPANLNEVLWKIILSYSRVSEICFKKQQPYISYTFMKDYNVTTIIDYNNIELFELNGTACKKIPKDNPLVTFSWEFNVPFKLSVEIINKLNIKLIPINETTYAVSYTGINFVAGGETYFKIDYFGRILIGIFLFFSTGALLWVFSRTIIIIKYGIFNKS